MRYIFDIFYQLNIFSQSYFQPRPQDLSLRFKFRGPFFHPKLIIKLKIKNNQNMTEFKTRFGVLLKWNMARSYKRN